ncbi:MAG: head GIN domain-containing protein [Salibacteraceae bacterium]
MILKNITLPLVLAFSFFAFAANAIEVKKEKTKDQSVSTFDFRDFNSLNINHAITVNLVQADEYKIEIEHDEKLKERLQVTLNGKELILDLQNGYRYKNVNIVATIHMPNISRLNLSGASTLLMSSINCEELEIVLAGASDIKGEVKTDRLKLKGSGASTAQLSGTAIKLDGSFSGASDLEAKNLVVSEKIDLRASGASDVSVTNNGEMTVSLSGASGCTYYGSGIIKSESITGASSIRKGK